MYACQLWRVAIFRLSSSHLPSVPVCVLPLTALRTLDSFCGEEPHLFREAVPSSHCISILFGLGQAALDNPSSALRGAPQEPCGED